MKTHFKMDNLVGDNKSYRTPRTYLLQFKGGIKKTHSKEDANKNHFMKEISVGDNISYWQPKKQVSRRTNQKVKTFR